MMIDLGDRSLYSHLYDDPKPQPPPTDEFGRSAYTFSDATISDLIMVDSSVPPGEIRAVTTDPDADDSPPLAYVNVDTDPGVDKLKEALKKANSPSSSPPDPNRPDPGDPSYARYTTVWPSPFLNNSGAQVQGLYQQMPYQGWGFTASNSSTPPEFNIPPRWVAPEQLGSGQTYQEIVNSPSFAVARANQRDVMDRAQRALRGVFNALDAINALDATQMVGWFEDTSLKINYRRWLPRWDCPQYTEFASQVQATFARISWIQTRNPPISRTLPAKLHPILTRSEREYLHTNPGFFFRSLDSAARFYVKTDRPEPQDAVENDYPPRS